MFLRKVVAFFRNICFFSQLKSPFVDVESPFSVFERRFNVYERRLYLPRFYLSYYSFCQSIHSVRVVLIVEAGTEEG